MINNNVYKSNVFFSYINELVLQKELLFLKSFYKSHHISYKEYNRILSIKNKKSQLQSIAARHLISIVLKNTNYEIDANYFGKPYLNGIKKYISISHSDNIVSVMFSNLVSGIDIEKALSHFPKIISNKWSKEEKNLDSYSIWTCKEAYIKSIGFGLRKSIFEVTIKNIDNNFNIILDKNNETNYCSYVTSIGDYKLSIVERIKYEKFFNYKPDIKEIII